MNTPTDNDCNFDAIHFRRRLHQYPELSSFEENTALLIAQQLEAFGLSPYTGIGGHGVVCTIDSGQPGETTLLRADFDALPITEKNDFSYCSQHEGVMHACGHDGHTATLMAVAQALSVNPPNQGKVILLFQPAEETGMGAASMLNDDWLAEQQVDNVFAYHNLPGYPLHTVIVKPDAFACASTGVTIELEGKTSHAARPENGVNPTIAMLKVIEYLQCMPTRYRESFTLVTVVHALLGEEAFGTAPGKVTIMATLRSDNSAVLNSMKHDLLEVVSRFAEQDNLTSQVNWQESFNAVVNSPAHCELVCEQANELGLPVEILSEPMRWSEDVAEFLQKWPGALFCVGSGSGHPELHNPDYDFPDALISSASGLFLGIIRRIHHSK
ncbi:amidohydrolase [Photobacterium sp. OFAV2-7]|uniref:amidohydrolase n=1 Tax=Photobacterium sp. OFAV2-7 TaxID=2917748 RepID=UPI001EF436AE|nr:amidohydrolase [Photobacterium sp. OFAV2-7]MCG7587897.1 amidohydrolase [Photobacterium sp. OFAV2-7]